MIYILYTGDIYIVTILDKNIPANFLIFPWKVQIIGEKVFK